MLARNTIISSTTSSTKASAAKVLNIFFFVLSSFPPKQKYTPKKECCHNEQDDLRHRNRREFQPPVPEPPAFGELDQPRAPGQGSVQQRQHRIERNAHVARPGGVEGRGGTRGGLLHHVAVRQINLVIVRAGLRVATGHGEAGVPGVREHADQGRVPALDEGLPGLEQGQEPALHELFPVVDKKGRDLGGVWFPVPPPASPPPLFPPPASPPPLFPPPASPPPLFPPPAFFFSPRIIQSSGAFRKMDASIQTPPYRPRRYSRSTSDRCVAVQPHQPAGRFG